MPKKSDDTKKGNNKVTYAAVAVIGLLLGYFSPYNVFSI
jgi:hypothetical protein